MYILREVLVIEQVNKRDSLSFGGVVLVMKPFYAIWLWECKVYFFILISLVSLNVKSNLYIMALVGLLRSCEAFSNLNYFYVPFLKLNG